MRFFGFYNLSFANTDGAGGYSFEFVQPESGLRPREFCVTKHGLPDGQLHGPVGTAFQPFLIARSGRPYNVVTSYDLTGDQFLNNRPSYADASLCTAGNEQYFQTQFGCLNAEPGREIRSYRRIWEMVLRAWPFNLRLSKTIGVGPKIESSGGVASGAKVVALQEVAAVAVAEDLVVDSALADLAAEVVARAE